MSNSVKLFKDESEVLYKGNVRGEIKSQSQSKKQTKFDLLILNQIY